MSDTHHKMLSVLSFYKMIIQGITRTLMRKNLHYVLSCIFLEYMRYRLQRLPKQILCWITLPDTALKHLLSNLENTQNEYIDYNSCALANAQFLRKLANSWVYVCSMVTMKKYKLMIISTSNINEDIILISETMRHNLQNALRCEQLNECFILPLDNNIVEIAAEAKISLIANPSNYKNKIIDVMLQNYFLHPRYLHVNDVFGIDAKEYAQDQFYSSGLATISVIYFVVKSLRYHNKHINNMNSCYVIYGETTLIQMPQLHSYIPRKHIHSFPDNILTQLNEGIQKLLNDIYPSALIEPLEYLESCIMPFLKKDIQLHVKPIFLIRGSQGCGKRRLIQIMSERMGLNLLDVDFAEVQTLIPAQNETKLHALLQKAEKCVPCVLYLNNIQVFGKTVEGQKNDRIISAFSTEIDVLYNKRQQFPLIIIAATDETELPAELQRIFVETIYVDHMNQNKRAEFISWLLSNRNLTTTANVSKIAELCSDFRFADLLALSLHAIKFRYKLTSHDSGSISTLTQEDLNRAYECMQSMYSDSRGAPRIPKVYWEDIGGLAELKREITRRIQLPLLNAFGFGQSGLLLYGPPGTGKTLLAKAVATEYQLHFLSIKGPEVLNMYVGESEKNVRQIFERARSAAPCIIFFDELDALAPNRGRSGGSSGVMDRMVSQLLAEMDGLEKSNGIFIMGATNRPDLLDPALLRPGRFDKMLYVGIYSDYASKLSVLQAQTRKFEFYENGRELELIMDHLPNNVTGADLYSVSSNAWLNAVRESLAKHQIENSNENQSDEEKNIIIDSIIVKLQHFLDAIHNLVPSVSKEEIERYNKMCIELS